MTNNALSHVYKVDKFTVPAQAREEFLEKVYATHAQLRKQSGFIRDLVLEQFSGVDEYVFVTLVEWASDAYIQPARVAIMAYHQEIGFNPQEMFARLGIKADLGLYTPLADTHL